MMHRKSNLILTVCALAVIERTISVSHTIFAEVATKPVVAHLAGGYSAPQGQAGDFVDSGWTLSGGATFHFNPEPVVGLRLDAGYSRFNATDQVISSSDMTARSHVDGGYLSMTSLSVDGIYEFGGKGHVGGYLGAGVGGYSRYSTVTETVLSGGVYCDPLWPGGVCFAFGGGGVIKSTDRLTKIGYDVILAISFPRHPGGEVYVEGRYHRMNSDPATEYFPIVIGYRW